MLQESEIELQAMMSVSLSHFRHSGMLRAVHDWLTSHYAHVPHTAAASILAALHTFGAASDRLCERVSMSLLPNLHSFSSGDRGRLAQIVWVLGTRADTAPFDALLNSAARRVAQHGGAGAGALSPLELSQLACGLRPALTAVRTSLLPALADDAAARLSSFTAQQVRLSSGDADGSVCSNTIAMHPTAAPVPTETRATAMMRAATASDTQYRRAATPT